MKEKIYSAWKEISDKALEGSLSRLNKISAGRWETDPSASFAPVWGGDYDAVCVYFEVERESDKMNFALFFNRKDIKFIAECFIGYSFFVSEKMGNAEEMLVSELGNIVLNSVISAMCNKLGIKLIPSVPKTIHSEKKFVLEVLSRNIPENENKTVIGGKINITCNGKKTFCEIFSFMSEGTIELLR